MKKTKQNQTETAISELIDHVENFFSTALLRSSTSTDVVVRNLSIANADQEPSTEPCFPWTMLLVRAGLLAGG